jgi:hypothetical protein
MAVFWKRMPSQTYISKEASAPAFKTLKDQITVLLGGNVNGGYKLEPLVVHHSENPRAFREISKSHLPVLWCSSKKGWITSDIISQYFSESLHRELQAYCKEKIWISRSSLLLITAQITQELLWTSLKTSKLSFSHLTQPHYCS